MSRFFFLSLIAFSVIGCSPLSHRSVKNTMAKMESKFQDHIGFSVYDPDSKKTLFDYKSANYFTPGSNTKIFTFYASLKLLGDSVPALRYVFSGDSLIFWGTGDPSLLYQYTQSNDRALNF